MKLRSVGQCDIKEIQGPYDLIIGASGYESRARSVATQLAARNVPVGNAFVFAFKEHRKDCARPENDRKFKALGYKSLLCSGRGTSEARACFETALARVRKLESARLIVDISSMTRAWYGEIVHSLMTQTRFRLLSVDFIYMPAAFVQATGEYPPNRVAGPVPGFVGMALPDKPTALGIGLGFHPERAMGLKDYLDPKLTVLFYASPSLDARYLESVRETNSQILSEVSENNIIAYPVEDCLTTFSMLSSLCDGLMRNSRVVLCSLGPKIFGLSCFLVAAMRPDMSIWRVSAEDRELPFDRKPRGTPIVLKTLWAQG